MTTEDSMEALQRAFESMTDDEVAAWLAGGDFTSVAGIALPAEAAARVTTLVSGAEVEGFAFDLDPLGGGLKLPSFGGATTGESTKTNAGGLLFRHCCQGSHYKKTSL